MPLLFERLPSGQCPPSPFAFRIKYFSTIRFSQTDKEIIRVRCAVYETIDFASFWVFLTNFVWRGDTNSSAWVEKERQNIPSAILVVKCPPPMKGSLSLEKLAEGTLYKGRIDGPRPPTTHAENQSPKSGLKDSFRSFCEFSNICWNGTRKLRADGDFQSKKLTRMVESSTTS